jgi:hypothetical protein
MKKIGLFLLAAAIVVVVTGSAAAQSTAEMYFHATQNRGGYFYSERYYEYPYYNTADLGDLGYAIGSFPRRVLHGLFFGRETECRWAYDSQGRQYKICEGSEFNSKGPPADIFPSEQKPD